MSVDHQFLFTVENLSTLVLFVSEVREDCRPNKVGGEDGKDVCTDEVDVDEGAVNCDVGVAPATGGEVAEPSVGVSKPDGEDETKLSFFFRNSSLLLAFLLREEGLILLFATMDFTSLPLVSTEKEKEVLVSLKLKVLPWLASS